MNLKENPEIKRISASLKEDMIDYLEDIEDEYTKSDVEKCMNIIDTYLTDISKCNSTENAMLIVKKAVIELNHLNEKCGYALIETDQREDIAEIIILAAQLKGFDNDNIDITEEWREW